MKTVFSLILLLSTYACSVIAQGDGGVPPTTTTHRCCGSLPTKTSVAMRDPRCTVATCNEAMKLTNFMRLNEFLDGCLAEANNDYTAIETIAKCALPELSRTNYMNFVFRSREQQQQMQSAQPGANQIAAAILGYGCIDTARTDACQKARTILRPSGGVLGLTPENFSVGGNSTNPGMRMQLKLDQAIMQCIASEVGAYHSSEWSGGMSQCASISTSTTAPTKLADFVQASSGSSCSECNADGLNGDHPFCGNYFSQPGQPRYGARCHKAQSAERIAKAFALHSHTARRLQLSSSISIDLTTKTGACQNYLSSLICETMFGTCSPTSRSLARPCKNRCEMELQSTCSMSAAAAASACQAASATGTGADCPAPTVPPTTEAPAVTPSGTPSVAPTAAYNPVNASAGEFVTVSGTSMRNEFLVTFCLTAAEARGVDSGRLAGLLQGAFQEVCEDLADNLEGNQCHMYNLVRDTADQCALRIKVTLSTSPIRAGSKPFRTVVIEKTGFSLAPAALMINTQSVPVTIVRRNVTATANSPAAVHTASSLLASAMLVMAALLF